MFDTGVEVLSRWQFALTAMYHFLFVPLTLGLAFLLFIMESVYVMTGKVIWRDMTKFWGKLFGINFAMGVATGITMEFQFGMNWSYYSHYVGDIFGAPLAIEGLMAFFLEATFIGLFFFGWNRIGKVQHLGVTFLMALGANLSALWILIANGWMQNPVGAAFNPLTRRMEIVDFQAVLFNPVAQAKFVHTVGAGYVTGALFVLGVSAWYLLKGRQRRFFKRSAAIASAFGLVSALCVAVLGDESGYALTENQRMKLAAIEGMWETEKAPAGFTVIGWPDSEEEKTHFAVKIPWVLGLLATRSLDREIPGIRALKEHAKLRIISGIEGLKAIKALERNPHDPYYRDVLEKHKRDIGYALLLRRYVENPEHAKAEHIEKAVQDTMPDVLVLFWVFRFMVGISLFMIFLFATGFILSSRRKIESKWFLRLALWSIPLPWIAAEAGWLIAEYGRQPWVIEGVLPTFMGVSSLNSVDLWLTLIGFTLLYGFLAVVEVLLILSVLKQGPNRNRPLEDGEHIALGA